MSVSHFIRRSAAILLSITAAIAAAGDEGALSATALTDVRGDPLNPLCKPPDFEGSLSIEEAIDIALCNNPKIKQGWATVMERSAALDDAKSDYYPRISLSGNVDRLRRKSDVKDLSIYDSDIDAQDQSLSVDARLVLYDFGKRSAAKKRAGYMIQVAERNRDITVLQACLETAAAYFDVVRALAEVTAAEHTEERAASSLQIARERREAGAGTMADVITAETVLARVQLRKSKAGLDKKLALGRLSVSMGLSVVQPLRVVGSSQHSPPGPPFGSVEQLLEIAESDSPYIESAREAYIAAQMAVQVARTANRPTIALVASGNRGSSVSKDAGNNYGPNDIPSDSTRSGYSIRLTVSVPLFTGFSSISEIHQARARQEQARWGVEDAKLRASASISSSFDNATSEVKNAELSGKLVELSGRALTATVERYRSGVGNLSDVILAQNAVDDAERDLIGSIARLRAAKMSLALAIGRMESWAFE